MPIDSNETNDVFFDTSVLVYAYDKSEPEKRTLAQSLLEKVFNGELNGYVSNQIFSELFFVLTEKKEVTKSDAEAIVISLIESERWVKINYDIKTVKNAVSSAKGLNVLFWDILISETMKENGIQKIYTENEADFKKISGIKVINPFKK